MQQATGEKDKSTAAADLFQSVVSSSSGFAASAAAAASGQQATVGGGGNSSTSRPLRRLSSFRRYRNPLRNTDSESGGGGFSASNIQDRPSVSVTGDSAAQSAAAAASAKSNNKWQSTWELTPKEIAKREKKLKRKKRRAELENFFTLGISKNPSSSAATATAAATTTTTTVDHKSCQTAPAVALTAALAAAATAAGSSDPSTSATSTDRLLTSGNQGRISPAADTMPTTNDDTSAAAAASKTTDENKVANETPILVVNGHRDLSLNKDDELQVVASEQPPSNHVEAAEKPKASAAAQAEHVEPAPPQKPPKRSRKQKTEDSTAAAAAINIPKQPPWKFLLDTNVNTHIDTLFKFIFENDSFFEMVTKKRYDEVSSFRIEPWSFHNDDDDDEDDEDEEEEEEGDEDAANRRDAAAAANGQEKRRMFYSFVQTIAFTRSTISVEQLLTKSHISPGNCYIVDVICRNSGVMYSDSFLLHLQYRFVRLDILEPRADKNQTKLTVQAEIEFIKPCLFKGRVESETWSGMKKYYEIVELEIQDLHAKNISMDPNAKQKPVKTQLQAETAGAAVGSNSAAAVASRSHPQPQDAAAAAKKAKKRSALKASEAVAAGGGAMGGGAPIAAATMRRQDSAGVQGQTAAADGGGQGQIVTLTVIVIFLLVTITAVTLALYKMTGTVELLSQRVMTLENTINEMRDSSANCSTNQQLSDSTSSTSSSDYSAALTEAAAAGTDAYSEL